MILVELTLRNWRNHKEISIHPSPKLNLVVGGNGTGKTNLAEAIYYLSLGRTWRGLSGEELIKKGEPEATLKAILEEGGNVRKIEVDLTDKKRVITLNGKPIKRLSDLSKAANMIAFSPKNASIFTGPPADRRSFLDLSIAKEDPQHLNDLNDFLKLLSERNAVLKNEAPDDGYLSVLTERLIAIQYPIIKRRKAYIERLEPTVKKVANAIFGKERRISVAYDPFTKMEGYEENAERLYEGSLESDKTRKSTTKGIQKEDFTVTLDDKEVGTYGSQGENRIMSLAMHLSPYFLTEEEGKKPIIVLDDVYSELDEAHRTNLTKLLERMGQVFITATETKITNTSEIEVMKLP